MFFIHKSNGKIHWTNHAKAKMRFYKLSEQRIKRVLNSPKRTEEGIAPNTVAMMQPTSVKTVAGKSFWKQEIWLMFQDSQNKRKIISAWRYPGVTKPGGKTIFDFIQQEYDEYENEEN
ncbi:hypothetical protein HZB06_01980 [Candidatus Wolfebacteria bacterium]|nr:hypothetical protein [Candidatus Wolfebacteria bacterium]